MIQLPSNWIKYARIREYPHDPGHATLHVNFVNEAGQVFNVYQQLESVHGDRPADHLDEALTALKAMDLEHMDPFLSNRVRQTGPAVDQNWTSVPAANTINLKEFREKYNLKDPEDRARA